MEICQLNSKPGQLLQAASARKRSRFWFLIILSALIVCGVVWFLTDALCSVLIEASTEALRPVAQLLRSETVIRATPKPSAAHSAVSITPLRPKIPKLAPTPDSK
jgi:hypothetical protein